MTQVNTGLEIMKGAKLTKAIETLRTDVKGMTARIHNIAVSCCLEVVDTGNTTRLNDFDKIVEHVGRRAIRRWLAKYGPVKWDMKANTFEVAPKKIEEAKKIGLETYGDALLNGPTYVDEATPSDTNPFKGFDLWKLVKAQITRFDALTEEEQADPRNYVEGIDELRALADKHLAKVTKTKPPKKQAKITVEADGEVAMH